MQLTRSCSARARSRDAAWTRSCPALAAAYAAFDCAGCRAAAEDIVTIEPRPWSIIAGRNALVVMNIEVRSESSTERQCPAVSSAVGTGMPPPPANGITISGTPSCSATVTANRWICSSSVQSATSGSARPPAASIDAATPASARSSRPTIATAAPASASVRAVAAPIPLSRRSPPPPGRSS